MKKVTTYFLSNIFITLTLLSAQDFDWNQDGKTNWWEYTIPFIAILIIEIIAEIIASWIF